MLEIACRHCDRRGRLRVAKLIAQYGADMRLPELRYILAADCPRVVADRFTTVAACIIRNCDRCDTISAGPSAPGNQGRGMPRGTQIGRASALE